MSLSSRAARIGQAESSGVLPAGLEWRSWQGLLTVGGLLLAILGGGACASGSAPAATISSPAASPPTARIGIQSVETASPPASPVASPALGPMAGLSPAADAFSPLASPGQSLTVFAASSLTDAFGEIAAAYQAATQATVEYNTGGSNTLRVQLEQGARAGVFASANQAEMSQAQQSGLLAGSPAIFARNRLTVIVPRGNPAGIETLADLADKNYKLALAAPNVPVGAYTREMLKKLEADPRLGAGFQERVLGNLVSDEPNVRQVVAKVQLGEADAAVVYASDVTPRVVGDLRQIAVPDPYNVVATYPIGILKGAENPALAGNFMDFVLSPEGQTILQKWGFLPVRS